MCVLKIIIFMFLLCGVNRSVACSRVTVWPSSIFKALLAPASESPSNEVYEVYSKIHKQFLTFVVSKTTERDRVKGAFSKILGEDRPEMIEVLFKCVTHSIHCLSRSDAMRKSGVLLNGFESSDFDPIQQDLYDLCTSSLAWLESIFDESIPKSVGSCTFTLTVGKERLDLIIGLVELLERSGIACNQRDRFHKLWKSFLAAYLGTEKNIFRIQSDLQTHKKWKNHSRVADVEEYPMEPLLTFKELALKLADNDLPTSTLPFFNASFIEEFNAFWNLFGDSDKKLTILSRIRTEVSAVIAASRKRSFEGLIMESSKCQEGIVYKAVQDLIEDPNQDLLGLASLLDDHMSVIFLTSRFKVYDPQLFYFQLPWLMDGLEDRRLSIKLCLSYRNRYAVYHCSRIQTMAVKPTNTDSLIMLSAAKLHERSFGSVSAFSSTQNAVFSIAGCNDTFVGLPYILNQVISNCTEVTMMMHMSRLRFLMQDYVLMAAHIHATSTDMKGHLDYLEEHSKPAIDLILTALKERFPEQLQLIIQLETVIYIFLTAFKYCLLADQFFVMTDYDLSKSEAKEDPARFFSRHGQFIECLIVNNGSRAVAKKSIETLAKLYTEAHKLYRIVNPSDYESWACFAFHARRIAFRLSISEN